MTLFVNEQLFQCREEGHVCLYLILLNSRSESSTMGWLPGNSLHKRGEKQLKDSVFKSMHDFS